MKANIQEMKKGNSLKKEQQELLNKHNLEKQQRENKKQENVKKREEFSKNPSKEFFKQNYEAILEEKDIPLYETSSHTPKGAGYSGYSMPNNAVNAYNGGEKPKSKWNKQEILNVIKEDGALNPIFEEIEKMSLKELQDNLLEKSSWHHTSKFYNKTDFYGVKSPLEIARYVLKNNDWNKW